MGPTRCARPRHRERDRLARHGDRSRWPRLDAARLHDTDWIAAFAPYPNWTPPQDFIPGTTAQYMWYWDSPASPSGGDGPLEAWFRYDLTLDASDLPADGRAAIVADDYFALYVNGNLIGGGHLEDCFCAYPVDFTPWLTVGDNVLAIYAYDGFHDGPADRLLEAVLFDTNAVVLPEPAASLLVAGGFTVLALSRRRRATILAEATPAACAALRAPVRRGRAPRRAHSALHDGSSK